MTCIAEIIYRFNFRGPGSLLMNMPYDTDSIFAELIFTLKGRLQKPQKLYPHEKYQLYGISTCPLLCVIIILFTLLMCSM